MDVGEVLISVLLLISFTSSEHCICTLLATEDTTVHDLMECFQQEDCRQILLLDKNYTLEESLNISNRSNVAISGIYQLTILQCINGIGITFTGMKNLSISNIVFVGCGQLHTAQKINFKAAVLITESINLSILNIEIVESDGTGLAMLNVAGTTDISNSNFKGNKVHSTKYAGGNGIYIELNLPHNQTAHIEDEIIDTEQVCETAAAEYHFTNCTLTDNAATAIDPTLNCDDGLYTGIGHGGAMSILLQHYPCYVEIAISNSSLSHNSAEHWGGAIEIVACRAKNNHIAITNTSIINNEVLSKGGGGGVDIDFSGTATQDNTVFISGTDFMRNSALYGGGVLISTHYAYNHLNNSVTFEKCYWIENSAHYASAVDIFPFGIIDGWESKPEIYFKDCTFESNYYSNMNVTQNVLRLGDGVVMTTGLIVDFGGVITFYNNSGSSIYAIASLLKFNDAVTALFHSNEAEVGAGVALFGSSAIVVGSFSNMTFINNTVARQGAAIYYYSIDKHIYVHEQRCFIQKLRESVSNASFSFIGNKAAKEPLFTGNGDYVASSIYTSTNLRICCTNETNCNFNDVGEFFFSSPISSPPNKTGSAEDGKISNYSQYFVEGEVNFTLEKEEILAIPGLSTKLPLSGNKDTTFDVTIDKSSISNITVAHSYDTIHSNKLKVKGESGETAAFTFTERSNRKHYFKLQISLEKCPPLFKLSPNLSCICYSSKDLYHMRAFQCDEHDANLHVGYWLGYAENKSNTHLISYCPSYCNDTEQGKYYIELPRKPHDLESTVCDTNRHGMLCGQCKANTTVYFYTRSFKCRGTENCRWGPFFYLLSEILPVTLLFLVVILFNISFTSGNLNGFIFFAQMYDTIVDLDVGQSYIIQDNKLRKLRILPHIIYRFFNLNYFGLDETSFCLWKDANTLDILAFKYLTVVYALVLVIGTMIVIRLCSAYGCTRLRKLKYSVIQGLSAFLVMAYSQCTELSFSILNAVNVYNGKTKSSTVVFLQGNIEYFSREHLPYAIPALCVMLFVAVLPLLLMSYPLCNKVIALFKLDDRHVFKHMSQLLPSVSRIKPFLDCFQGTFKDDRRFFAGLYFAYRVAILGSTFAPTILVIYAILELQLIIMLVLHVVFWPYQRRIHNIVDTLLLANLAIITILNMLINIEAEKINIFVTYLIELALLSIPIMALLIYCMYGIIQKLKSSLRQKEDDHKRDTKIMDDLFLEDDVRNLSMSSVYRPMREREK